ncbi:unnamed protein product [Cladocopium goreaui]|uniref:Uncharacterized peptidase C1-like protein L477 n=1 Tax=Cladocopium goreaui TaxID=2562237 RepID=A0A9P1M4Q8_9DINO|nr:unnamed protein product [Cladocopium goreaui]
MTHHQSPPLADVLLLDRPGVLSSPPGGSATNVNCDTAASKRHVLFQEAKSVGLEPQIHGTCTVDKHVSRKVVLDGKTFAPFGMVPHAVEPEKVAAYRPKAGSGQVPAKVDLRKYMTHVFWLQSKSRLHDRMAFILPICDDKVSTQVTASANVEDQSQTNSCCANAVAGAYEYINKRYAMSKGDRTDDISRLFIYYVGRKKDQQLFREDTTFPACNGDVWRGPLFDGLQRLAPKDEGMSLGGAISALELKGACLERNWPFDIDKVNNRPVEPCFNEALRYKIAESEKVPVDLSSMRRCLAEGHPIVFGLKLTAQFFKPAAGGGISTPDPDDPQSSEHGLHAMLIVGYSDRQEVFIVRNSWGTSWGDGGLTRAFGRFLGHQNLRIKAGYDNPNISKQSKG